MTKLVFYFLLRNKIKYEIIILVFMGIYSSLQAPSSQYGLTYMITLLGILYIVYFKILRRHNRRISLLYSSNRIKRFKPDLIKAVVTLSCGFFFLAIFLDLFILRTVCLIYYHLLTLVVFILSTRFVTISVEKRQNTSQIVTFKEGLKIITLGLGLVILTTASLYIIGLG